MTDKKARPKLNDFYYDVTRVGRDGQGRVVSRTSMGEMSWREVCEERYQGAELEVKRSRPVPK